MNAIIQSARGAAVYTPPGYRSSRSFNDTGYSAADDAATPVRTWVPTIDELLRIRSLNDDWDGEGADAPHPALVDGAISLAQSYQANGEAPPDRVHVGVNGTIYFEWHSSIEYLEIEVISPVEAECRRVRKGSEEAESFVLSRDS